MKTYDRVRAVTPKEVNQQIDRDALNRLHQHEYSSYDDISRRMIELDREWDMERLLETNASALALTGLALGHLHNKRWLLVPAIVLPFLLQHAVQGWSPPVPIFRRLGVRTRKEIDQEKYALKVLRGDFGYLTSAAPDTSQELADHPYRARS